MNELENEKQQQVTAGFKVDKNLKEAIDTMIEASGMKKNEWLAQAYEAMRGKGIKDTNQEYTKEIEEVDYLSRRIYELFNNMIVQSVHIKESAVLSLETEIKQYKELLQETRNELKECKEKLSSATDTVDIVNKEKEELEVQYEEAKTNLNHVQDLITELKEKTQKYETEISILQPMAQENLELKSRLDDTLETLKGLDSKLESLENESAKQKQEFLEKENQLTENYTVQIKQIEKKYETENEQLKLYQEQQIKHLAEQAQLEKEKELLQQEKLHQQEMKKIQEEMNLKIQSLYEKMDKKEEKYEKEITKLQKKLEQIQIIEGKKKRDESQ
ncbi:hypothetical protein [Bacillus cereus]|uniref:Uncharacterized protein n=1 Tax=Bacillus cereus VD184 TaxID=1053242 RepID=A0A9W5R259_BACCE|nr:hypothetical protein [Bacillus cereus]EOQ01282.1 hypothetical protein IKC_06540 [Bacillus cereus VD184]EOQ01714.1 hypothetical protein IKC_06600 [Bacillus cereus VD184]EOQ04933.1 hypothetical protein IKC_06310 [Bacillus cereus VD184]EOQ05470.1 hypothetical protein IKC_06314 [Bacillus cereus VD184]EOQ09376.1 hypothetical protein IKC_05775 [Bacillus cereus VD184]